MSGARVVVLAIGVLEITAVVAGCRGRAPAHATTSAAAADTGAGSPMDTSIYAARVLPVPELDYNAREGQTVYKHFCATCHGDAGGGDGFNAYNLDPRPRPLADSTFQAQHTDADLAAAIRSGGGAIGLSTGMPPWGRTLNARQIENVVRYVRTLRAGSAP